jgi:hypothetical protein
MQNLNKIQKGQPDYHIPLNENADELDRRQGIHAPAIHLANGTYKGVDLTPLYLSEVSQGEYPTIYDWLRARIRAEDWHKLNIHDYIPFMTTQGIPVKAEIVAIDPYYDWGDGAEYTVAGAASRIPHNIMFCTKDCLPDPYMMNRINYNNGTSVNASPYQASDLEARLNSKQKNVPNAAAANPALISADYRTAGGILHTFPQALQNVLMQPRLLIPTRYLATALLTDDTGWAWNTLDKLRLPFEFEVYGSNMWGTLNPAAPGNSKGGFIELPGFENGKSRIKMIGDGGTTRTNWWLASASGGSATGFARRLLALPSALRRASISFNLIIAPPCAARGGFT